MNRIQQFAEDQAVLNSAQLLNPIADFKKGFDAAIELNLPVHFSEFLTSYFIIKTNSSKNITTWILNNYRAAPVPFLYNELYSIDEIYTIWINKIFEPKS